MSTLLFLIGHLFNLSFVKLFLSNIMDLTIDTTVANQYVKELFQYLCDEQYRQQIDFNFKKLENNFLAIEASNVSNVILYM